MRKINYYFIPSLLDVLFVCLLIGLFCTGSSLLGDGDTGYHIRAGQIILDTWTVPKVDPFSYITPTLPWTAHEWLSEVIMALAHNTLGLTGVVLLFVFLIAITYTYLYKSLRRQNGNLFLILGIFILVITTSSIHWLARPHIFSLLFFVLWYDLLDRFHYDNVNYLYLFPPMMLLWANLHGGFIIGLILLGVYFVGNFLEGLCSKGQQRALPFNKCRVIVIIGLACVFAAMINPYGYKILLFPFKLVGDSFIMSIINEFMPTNAQTAHLYVLYLVITLTTLMLSRRRINSVECLLIILFIYMSLYSIRYITMFAIIAAPIVLKRLNEAAGESKLKIMQILNRRSDSIWATDATARGFLWPAAALIVVAALATSGFVKHDFDPKNKPVQAVEFLQNVYLPCHMFNNDEFGDYMIYKAFPSYRVFIDGRGDMYGTHQLKDYLAVSSLGADWEKVLQKYQIKWVFFDADSLLSRYLSQRADWHLIYADKVAHIYVRNIPEFRNLIARYPNVKPVIQKK